MGYHGADDAMLCEKIRADLNKADFNFEIKCEFRSIFRSISSNFWY